jgi:transcription antitermination factor NusG
MTIPPSIKDWETWQAALQAEPRTAIPDQLPGLWWVAHTRPRNEKALALDLRVQHIFHYLPLRLRSTRSKASGRISRSLVPVFPGYVFFNGDDRQRQRALMTNRIANALPVVNQAELVDELRQIQRLLASQTEFEWEPAIQVGQWARVITGPLQGIEGIVCKRLARLRLALNVRMLSQSVVVEVSRELLERIDAPSFKS